MPDVKRYIIKKFVMAKSASDAIRQEKRLAVDSVWLDDEWLAEHTKQTIGFKAK